MLIPPFSTYPLFKLSTCILTWNGVNSYPWTFQTTTHRRTQQRCLTTSACGSQRRPPFQGPWATAYLQQSTTLQAFGVSHWHTQQQAHSTHKEGYQHSEDITWSQQQRSYGNSHLASKGYCRRFGSLLLCFWDVFWVLINVLYIGLILFQVMHNKQGDSVRLNPPHLQPVSSP